MSYPSEVLNNVDTARPTPTGKPDIDYPFDDIDQRSGATCTIKLLSKDPNLARFYGTIGQTTFEQTADLWNWFLTFSNQANQSYYSQFSTFKLRHIESGTAIDGGWFEGYIVFANKPQNFSVPTMVNYLTPKYIRRNAVVSNGTNMNVVVGEDVLGGGGESEWFFGRMEYRFYENVNNPGQITDLPKRFKVVNFDPTEPTSIAYVNSVTPQPIIDEYNKPETTPERRNEILARYSAFRTYQNWQNSAKRIESDTVDRLSDPDINTYEANYLSGDNEIVPVDPVVERYVGDIWVARITWIKLYKTDQNDYTQHNGLVSRGLYTSGYYLNFGENIFINLTGSGYSNVEYNQNGFLLKGLLFKKPSSVYFQTLDPWTGTQQLIDNFDKSWTFIVNATYEWSQSEATQVRTFFKLSHPNGSSLQINYNAGTYRVLFDGDVIADNINVQTRLFMFSINQETGKATFRNIDSYNQDSWDTYPEFDASFGSNKPQISLTTDNSFADQGLFEVAVLPAIPTDADYQAMLDCFKTNFSLRPLFFGY